MRVSGSEFLGDSTPQDSESDRVKHAEIHVCISKLLASTPDTFLPRRLNVWGGRLDSGTGGNLNRGTGLKVSAGTFLDRHLFYHAPRFIGGTSVHRLDFKHT